MHLRTSTARFIPRAIPAAFAVLVLAAPSLAQPPVGQSARLFGVHDLSTESQRYIQDSTASCDKGWITHLTYLEGGSGAITVPEGVSIIQRLDWSGTQSAPQDHGQRGLYADRFIETVRNSPGVHVWIVGNEPNFTISGGFSPLSAFIEPYIEPFVDNYARIRDRVHALEGHREDAVLLPAPSPWSPCFLEGFARVIRGINERGVDIDGFAIHPGTRHPSDSQRSERVRSTARAPGNCEVGYTESADQYDVFRDFIRVVDENGHSTKPLFITESAHNTDDTSAVNHVDEDRGFFSAMYETVAAWNRVNGGRIRALTPYRFERFGDGTARDHSLRGKASLHRDHRRGASYTWTSTRCGDGEGSCEGDEACPMGFACREGNCEPIAAEPTDCPCDVGEVCRLDSNICVEMSAGPAAISFDPEAPAVGDLVRIDVFALDGHTNIDLEWEGPLGSDARPATEFQGVEPGHHWLYDTVVDAEGTYRATFRADPDGTTYGVAYLNVVGTSSASDAGPLRDGGPGFDGGAAFDGGARRDVGGADVGAEARHGPGELGGGCSCHIGEGRPSAFAFFVLFLVGARTVRRGGPS